MQPERQIAIFCVMTGGALAFPEVRNLVTHPDAVPGGQLMTGGFFGAVAVFFGTLLALDSRGLFRLVMTGFWCLVSIAFAAAMEYGALRSPGPVRLGLFEFFAGLAAVAFFGTLYGTWRAGLKR